MCRYTTAVRVLQNEHSARWSATLPPRTKVTRLVEVAGLRLLPRMGMRLLTQVRCSSEAASSAVDSLGGGFQGGVVEGRGGAAGCATTRMELHDAGMWAIGR